LRNDRRELLIALVGTMLLCVALIPVAKGFRAVYGDCTWNVVTEYYGDREVPEIYLDVPSGWQEIGKEGNDWYSKVRLWVHNPESTYRVALLKCTLRVGDTITRLTRLLGSVPPKRSLMYRLKFSHGTHPGDVKVYLPECEIL